MLSRPTTSRAGSKNDPMRKQRIITATASILRTHGVDGVTFRRVAAEAGVPLGSTTYYFTDKDELLLETITVLRTEADHEFRRRLAALIPSMGGPRAVAHLVSEITTDWRDSFLSGYGVYLINFTQPQLRRAIQDWHEESLGIMQDFFTPEISTALNFLIEGMLLKSVIADTKFAVDDVLPSIERVFLTNA